MKRIAIILIPIFLLVSLALTVYIVVTQRMEMRKKAEEVTLKTYFGSSQKGGPITDRCGSYVEVSAVSTSYNPQTGVQTLNLKAERAEEQKVGAKAPAETAVSPTTKTTATPIPTATKVPASAQATASPTVSAATATVTPTKTATTTLTLAPEVKGESVSYKVPLDQRLDFTMLEQGCTNGSVNPNMCTSCDASDPGYFSSQVVHTIPAGQVETSFSISVKKPANQLICGCIQLDLHIWDVNYPGSTSGVGRQQECNTLGNNHDYLYAVGMAAANCTEIPATSPTATTTVRPPTSTPSQQGPTATPTTRTGETPTPNQVPLCSSLTVTPNSGTTPLTVHFIGSGTDPDGPVLKWEFNYGDGTPNQVIEKNIGNTGSVEIDHTYTKKGAFTASFRIQDNNGVWSNPISECSVSINTTGQQGGVKTATPSATPKLKKTASSSATPVAPNVPKSGNLLPTLTIGLGGLLILGLGLLFAL